MPGQNSRKLRQRRRVVLMLHQNSHPSPTEIGLDTSLFSSVESTSSDSPDVSCPETVISENSVDCHWNDRAVCGRIVARLGSQSKQLLHRVTRYPVVVLGSRSDCDWPLPGSGLAELQACFLFIDKRIYCVDLTGTYALKVRGGRFQQIWVHDGSVVEIGNLRLRLYTGENTHESGAISSGTESRRPLNDRIDPIADEAQLETDAEEFACSRFLELTKNGSISPRRYEMTRNITLIGRDSPSQFDLRILHYLLSRRRSCRREMVSGMLTFNRLAIPTKFRATGAADRIMTTTGRIDAMYGRRGNPFKWDDFIFNCSKTPTGMANDLKKVLN